MSNPLVSIVLPVYNAERYIAAAVRSMIAQTFTDWEMICINDGSRDGSGGILDQLAAGQPRMRVVHQENVGLVHTLNRGIAMAQAPLIARMDADDIAMPDRLARQVGAMSDRPNCVALGGAILKIDAETDPLGIDRLPVEHAEIEAALLHRRTGLFHPTTLLRKAAVEAAGGYRPDYNTVEDHDLWLRLAQRGQLCNLPDVVLCYRLHSASVCWQKSAMQRELMNKLLKEAYALRGLEMPSELLVSESQQRSAAGPGKWARMAAKGYAPRTAIKHLWRMWHEPASFSYRARMTTETLTRIVCSLPQLPLRQLPDVPRVGAN